MNTAHSEVLHPPHLRINIVLHISLHVNTANRARPVPLKQRGNFFSLVHFNTKGYNLEGSVKVLI